MIDFTSKTYRNILDQMLGRVPDTYDKRDTSPIQTALGPAAYALEEYYLNLNRVQLGAYISTAEGEDLDELAVIAGLKRFKASAAIRLGIFNIEIPIGSRFSTINGENSINFAATATYARNLSVSINKTTWDASPLGGVSGTFAFVYDGGWTYDGEIIALSTYGITFAGSPVFGDKITVTVTDDEVTAVITTSSERFTYQLTAETAGTIGNDYIGAILPISVINGLTSAQITDILVLGDDVETDASLRARIIEALNDRPFGGNVSQYRQEVLELDGVGAVQVYPTWNGGGTVKVSILGTDYKAATQATIEAVQTALDPEVNQGVGLGLAPIGAVVTVSSPEEVSVNVTATVTLAPGYSVASVIGDITDAIDAYLKEVREGWATPISDIAVAYAANVYNAKISAAILSVQGVLNVSGVTVNGVERGDLMLTETGALQQIPVLGQVVINE